MSDRPIIVPLGGFLGSGKTTLICNLLKHVPDRRLAVLLDNCKRFVAGEPLRNLVDKARWF